MVSLLPYNTFHLDVQARELIMINSKQQLIDIAQSGDLEGQIFLILGGGSNMLFTHDRDGIVLLNQIQGKEILTQDDETVTIKVGGGENWHELVMRTVQQGRWGLENLALIPGSVGAAPVQNIGAYGVEAKDSILSVSGVDLSNGKPFELTNTQCQFGYRDSVFKRPEYTKYFITHVTWKLSKIPHPRLGYADITKTIETGHINPSTLTAHDIAEMIIRIRQSKLPDWTKMGTAGSFYKNPIVSVQTADALKSDYPTMPIYPIDDARVKLSAGRLIDQCGWKNVQHGAVGTYEKHALVLVHHGGGTGQQLWDFAQQIMHSVSEKFGVRIEPEVRVV